MNFQYRETERKRATGKILQYNPFCALVLGFGFVIFVYIFNFYSIAIVPRIFCFVCQQIIVSRSMIVALLNISFFLARNRLRPT